MRTLLELTEISLSALERAQMISTNSFTSSSFPCAPRPGSRASELMSPGAAGKLELKLATGPSTMKRLSSGSGSGVETQVPWEMLRVAVLFCLSLPVIDADLRTALLTIRARRRMENLRKRGCAHARMDAYTVLPLDGWTV